MYKRNTVSSKRRASFQNMGTEDADLYPQPASHSYPV